MKVFQHFWEKIVPDKFRNFVRFLLEPKKLKVLRRAVLKQYKSKIYSDLQPEIVEGLKYLRRHKFSAYPYKWALKYDNWIPEVNWDVTNQCFYILFEAKKMYFPRRYSKTEVIWIVRSIYKEQDIKSPHVYLTPEFHIDDNSIVIDAGVAEGNFALSVVEKAKKVYLIECDTEWIESLRLTFSPWKHKVIIVEKYLSDSESENTISVDALVKPGENESYFIKMDIEGYEKLALMGIKNLIASNSRLKLNVCTYHNAGDFVEILAIIKQYGLNYQISDSYILFYRPGDIPEFRKVLIRAWKS